MDLIQRSIDRHGAKAVYDAAARRIEGDAGPLQAVGLAAEALGEAWGILTQAHRQMPRAEQAREHWNVSRMLTEKG